MNLPLQSSVFSIDPDKLPSLPSVAIEIVRLSKSDEVSLDEFANAVAIDPSITTKMLRLANSARYQRNQEVTDLTRACFVLGMRTFKIMALGFSVAKITDKDKSEFDLTAYWTHSIACAVAAREFARLVNSQYANEAFICGLLSRIGQLAMMRVIPERYEELMEFSAARLPTADDEFHLLKMTHHDLAKTLLTKWGLPKLLVDAVSGWREPEFAGEAEEVCKILRVADHVARITTDSEKGEVLQQLHEFAGLDFGLTPDEVDLYVVDLNDEVIALARVLDVKLEDQTEYQDLINSAREQMVEISLQAALDLESTSVDLGKERQRSIKLADESKENLVKSQIDALTGVANRGVFDEKLRHSIQLRIQGNVNSCFGVVMIDVDHFKLFNDSYGHLVGDKVLVEVAKAVKKSLRPTDFFARYGGEEFVIVVGECGKHEIELVAERTRKIIESVEIENEGDLLKVTASAGGAYGNRFNNVSDGVEMVRLADKCLYQSKESGRNQCTFAEFTPRACQSSSS